MVAAAALAVLMRCNLPLSVGLVWLTNPLTMPAIFYMAYRIGAMLIEAPVQKIQFELSFYWLTNHLEAIWQPFLLGCLLCGLFFGSLGYFVISILWRIRVARNWRKRKKRRKLAREMLESVSSGPD